MNIKKAENICETYTKKASTACKNCSDSSCALKSTAKNKPNTISSGKIIKNGLRAIVLGIVLYSAYDQFIASKKKSQNIKTLISDTLNIKTKINGSDSVKINAIKSILSHK